MARLAVSSRPGGPPSLPPKSPRFSHTLGSRPTPQPGALGPHRPRPPAVLGLCSADTLRREHPAPSHSPPCRSKVSPSAMLLPPGVTCPTDGPVLRTLCHIQPGRSRGTLEARAEPGPWLPCARPLALGWPGPIRRPVGAACARAWPGTGSKRAAAAAAGRFPSPQGDIAPLCSAIRGWGESGEHGPAVCSQPAPPAPRPRAGQRPQLLNFSCIGTYLTCNTDPF